MSGYRFTIPRFRVRWSWFVGLFCITALAAWLLHDFHGLWRAATPMSALIAAVDTDRPIEARLTGGWRYGAWKAPAAADAFRFRREVDVRLAVARVHAAHTRPSNSGRDTTQTAEGSDVLGVTSLMLGNLDAAVLHLEDAVAWRPDSASSHSDLAAAYLARARVLDQPDDYPRAIAAAERALRISPDLVEAQFNLALALEQTGLAEGASDAWASYLARDGSSPWSVEARVRRAAIANQASRVPRPLRLEDLLTASPVSLAEIIRLQPDRSRELFDDEFLPSWGAAWVRGDASSLADLTRTCARLSAALTTASGDAMPRALCAEFETLTPPNARRSSERRTEALAKGLVEFGRARALYTGDKIADAAKSFVAARAYLEKAGSPQAEWCTLHEAIVNYYAGDYAAVRERLSALVKRAGSIGYRRLAARGHWMLGLTALQQTDYNGVLKHYGESLNLFTAAGDATNALAVGALLAEVMMHLADRRAEWDYRVDSLRSAAVLPPRRQHNLLIGCANACLREDMPEAALRFARAALNLARRVGSPATELEARLFMARAGITGSPETDEHLRAAHDLLRRLPAGALTSRLATELTIAEADVRSVAPDGGIGLLDHAIATFERQESWLRTSRLYEQRAAAHVRLGNDTLAERDLMMATTHFANARRTLPKNQMLQLSHFEDGWPAFTQLAHLRARQQRYEEAAAVATQGRLLLLAPRVPSFSSPAAAEPRMLAIRTPADTAVVSYVVLSDRLLMWSIVGEQTTFAERLVGRQTLRRSIERFRRALQAGDPEWTREARGLYELVLGPLASTLRPATAITILPDDALASLPFTALIDPSDGRALIDRFVMSFAVPVAEKTKARPSTATRAAAALVIDAGAAGTPLNLPVLSSSAGETTAVARMFRTATLLRADRATRTSVLEAARQRPAVIHFAGHAVASPERPLTSRLILSGAEPLFAYDIAEQRLAGTEVVFLAACTSLGGPVGGAGLVGLSSAMIGAGAESVVGTLWDVGDGSAAAFSQAFYRGYANGATTPARAFRAAVLEMRANIRTEGPQAWALWTVVEGLRIGG